MQPKYLKRYRMEINLREADLARPALPEGYAWAAWHPELIFDHALAKFESFHTALDTQIFPALRTLPGCRDLMRSIANHETFLPQATWLIFFRGNEFRPPLACGTVQGLAPSPTLGAIQNIGIIPDHRGMGLGRALLLRTLHGFRSAGLLRVTLDVSAENGSAVKLYESIGFEHTRTSYREVVVPAPAEV